MPEHTRATRADARRNHEQLLATANEVFTELGADASLNQVAKRAGVGIGTLYRHFPTRDALLVATLQDSLLVLENQARKLLDAKSPGEALKTWLKAYVKHATTYRGLAVCLPPLQNNTSACELTRNAGAALLERAQAAGEVRDDIDFDDVSAMTVGVAFATQEAKDATRRKRVLTLFLDSLEPR
ncbi:TetR/AcrR family transcriptional regulator [Vitiosangium sp. GDMCC 1.1324]|uniref:TetR/AcrR family transcriptional regulator n=1 Tax=Vitiosangium sp. (strain GDMCC 1.1324) TaxID=2138576 RepID=UPI000D3C56B9|nr:TetR/AcrR family transcriptional regulator [Vitiosangium sp. GDMCC 1.1324]PTL81531.1 TetR family transcriptional regulator [Vitiosangium sp. GDMCC 1.1324]